MRYENWPSLLDKFLLDEQPFEWGKRDCCLFAADAVLCMTGFDYAESFRGKYNSEEGAYALIPCGIEAITNAVGMERINPLLAQRGDLVLIETLLGDTLGIVDMSGDVSAQGLDGVKRVPITRARCAWRV